MRILIVSPHYWPEPCRISDVAEGLKAHHDVTDLTNVPDYPSRHFSAFGPLREEHEGIEVVRAPGRLSRASDA